MFDCNNHRGNSRGSQRYRKPSCKSVHPWWRMLWLNEAECASADKCIRVPPPLPDDAISRRRSPSRTATAFSRLQVTPLCILPPPHFVPLLPLSTASPPLYSPSPLLPLPSTTPPRDTPLLPLPGTPLPGKEWGKSYEGWRRRAGLGARRLAVSASAAPVQRRLRYPPRRSVSIVASHRATQTRPTCSPILRPLNTRDLVKSLATHPAPPNNNLPWNKRTDSRTQGTNDIELFLPQL